MNFFYWSWATVLAACWSWMVVVVDSGLHFLLVEQMAQCHFNLITATMIQVDVPSQLFKFTDIARFTQCLENAQCLGVYRNAVDNDMDTWWMLMWTWGRGLHEEKCNNNSTAVIMTNVTMFLAVERVAEKLACNATLFNLIGLEETSVRYSLGADSKSWNNSLARCLLLGAKLVEIESEAEMELVSSSVTATIWTGESMYVNFGI